MQIRPGPLEPPSPKFRRVVVEDPGNTLAHFHPSECYLKLREPVKALEEWKGPLKLDSSHEPAAGTMGQYWIEQGGFAKARLRFAQGVVVAESYSGHFHLGLADKHLGRLQEARRPLQTARAIASLDEKCAQELNDQERRIQQPWFIHNAHSRAGWTDETRGI